VKNKIVWLLASGLITIAFILSSCAPAAPAPATPAPAPTPTPKPAPTPTPAQTPAPALEKPKYGGALVFVRSEPTLGFDDAYQSRARCYSVILTNQPLIIGNWAKGLAGTGETDWYFGSDQLYLMAGAIAESWELPDPNTMIFHIRKGVRWHDKSPVNGRELTAGDVVFSIERVMKIPVAYSYRVRPWVKSITAPDKWTAVIKGQESEEAPTVSAFQTLAMNTAIWPRELIEKYGDARDWRVSCGTGPFMLADDVAHSSTTLKRNPSYWMKDPIYPENQLPYLDSVKILIIPDASTRIAALRTGKVDQQEALPKEDRDSLVKTCPELKEARILGHPSAMMYMRTDKPGLPFKDIRVRRALAMAIDKQAILKELYQGQGELLVWPLPPVPQFKDAYTPVDKLPPETRELFEYHPDKAKQLLAEAGYPHGFKTEIVCIQGYVDVLSIVAAYWAKIGVELKLDVREYAVWNSIRSARSHKEMFSSGMTHGYNYNFLNLGPTALHNWMMINDPYINERKAALLSWENMGNRAKQAQLAKEITLRDLSQAWWIQPPTPYVYTMWWPWVKGYHGEYSLGFYNQGLWSAYVWVDQELKESMRR